MCERRDSIAALSAAADRLSAACEGAIRAVPGAAEIDPARPSSSGVVRALRKSLGELSATPADMAVTLRRIK